MYVLVCVFKIFSETTGPTVAKFHVEPQWDRGGKFIQIIPVICCSIPVICCSSFEYCPSLGAGAFRRAFTTNVAPQCRAFSRALEIEKLKAPLFRGPKGAGIQMTGALIMHNWASTAVRDVSCSITLTHQCNILRFYNCRIDKFLMEKSMFS